MLCPKSNTQARGVARCWGVPQRARTARLFGVLIAGHGSPPNVAGNAGMEQLGFPTQSFETALFAEALLVAHGPAAIEQFGIKLQVKFPPSAKVVT